MSQGRWASPAIQHRKSIPERFWEKVTKSPTGCWLWQGYISRLGYGMFMGKHAHRIAWELTKGPISPNLDVCHHCDNPPCVNPSHLFLGTASDNLKDSVRKGRLNHSGERNGNAKLTETLIREIRSSVLTIRNLATRFGVSETNISSIQKGLTWKLVK